MSSYAIIKTGGKQYRVAEGEVLDVEKLGVEKGKSIDFDQVLLVKRDEEVHIGTPTLEAKVSATILEDIKDKKIRVLKYKAKSHYKRTLGHRQPLSRIKIVKISLEKGSK